VARVLRPGGRFFFEEVTSQALNRRAYQVFEHPIKDRFSKQQFITELETHGLVIGPNVVERLFGDFIFGVARKGENLTATNGEEYRHYRER
jgi:hypothetical protein